MASWLLEPIYWNWLLLGIFLLVVELLAPGTFFLWMGVAAFCVGLLLIPFPSVPWQYQWLIFAILSVASIIIWRTYFQRYFSVTDEPFLNRRGQQYIGRVFNLDAPIVNGYGRIRVDDSIWKIKGPDCPEGTRVRVVAVEGVILKVQIESTQAVAGVRALN